MANDWNDQFREATQSEDILNCFTLDHFESLCLDKGFSFSRVTLYKWMNYSCVKASKSVDSRVQTQRTQYYTLEQKRRFERFLEIRPNYSKLVDAARSLLVEIKNNPSYFGELNV